MSLGSEARDELASLEGIALSESPASLETLGRDRSHFPGSPAGVVTVTGTSAVLALVAWARRHRIPLIPRGGGTSLDGESVATEGSVVVDLSGLGQLLEVDPVDRVARVQPGVVNYELNVALAAHGLFFPPNPGSWRSSTIGGNVATNASGPRSFAYGPTRRWVRGLEAVLGTGELLRAGSRAAKRSVGPDLLGLLVGSEGTLGLVTEVTLALAPRPGRRMGLVVPLPGGVRLGRLVASLLPPATAGLSAVEYLDAECAAALARTPGARLPGGSPLLLLEVESSDEVEEEARLARLVTALAAGGVTSDPLVFPEADRLWTVRGESGVALDRELGNRLREDLAVPLSRLDEMLARLGAIAAEEGVRSVTFAHLGEASLHPNLVVAPGSVEGERVRARLLHACLELGGTVSAEHGIGLVKPRFLREELGATGLRLLREVKRACDPDGILNPGKLYPPPAGDLDGVADAGPQGRK